MNLCDCCVYAGTVTADDIRHDIMNAWKTGDEAFHKFLSERIASTRVDFFEKLTKNKLKIFTYLTKVSASPSSHTALLRVDRHVFACMVVVAQTQKLNLQEVLSYNPGPLPLSLSNLDGSLSKTNKAKFMHLLEEKCGERAQWSIPSAHATYIIDAMTILQMQSRAPTTFGDLADVIFSVVTTSLNKGGNRVDFVADQYHDISIKGWGKKASSATNWKSNASYTFQPALSATLVKLSNRWC